MRPQLAASVVAYQIVQDWVREGEAERVASSVRARHTGAAGGTIRRLTHGLIAPGRLFHVAHAEGQRGLLGGRVATQTR